MSENKNEGNGWGCLFLLLVFCVPALFSEDKSTVKFAQTTLGMLALFFMIWVFFKGWEFFAKKDGWRKIKPYVVWILWQLPFSVPLLVPAIKQVHRDEDWWFVFWLFVGSVVVRYPTLWLASWFARRLVRFFRWWGITWGQFFGYVLLLWMALVGATAIMVGAEYVLFRELGAPQNERNRSLLIGLFVASLVLLYGFFLFALRVAKPAAEKTVSTLRTTIIEGQMGRGWFLGGMGLCLLTSVQFGYKAKSRMSPLELGLFLVLFGAAMVWASWRQQKHNNDRDWKDILSEKKLLASVIVLVLFVVVGGLMWKHNVFFQLIYEHGLLTAVCAGLLVGSFVLFVGGCIAWLTGGLSIPFACVSVATVLFSILYFRAPKMDDLLVLSDLFELFGAKHPLLEWVTVIGLSANGVRELQEILSVRS